MKPTIKPTILLALATAAVSPLTYAQTTEGQVSSVTITMALHYTAPGTYVKDATGKTTAAKDPASYNEWIKEKNSITIQENKEWVTKKVTMRLSNKEVLQKLIDDAVIDGPIAGWSIKAVSDSALGNVAGSGPVFYAVKSGATTTLIEMKAVMGETAYTEKSSWVKKYDSTGATVTSETESGSVSALVTVGGEMSTQVYPCTVTGMGSFSQGPKKVGGTSAAPVISWVSNGGPIKFVGGGTVTTTTKIVGVDPSDFQVVAAEGTDIPTVVEGTWQLAKATWVEDISTPYPDFSTDIDTIYGPPNTPPEAADLGGATAIIKVRPSDTTKTIVLAGTDADGDTLTYTIVTQPTKGTLTGTGPNVVYTQTAGSTGTDTFTYKVNDGKANSNVATVTITFGANIAPVAAAVPVTVRPTDVTKTIVLNGTDAEGDALTYSIVTPPDGTKGTVVLTAQGPNVVYTQVAGATVSDTFTYKVNDGTADSAPATVTVTFGPNTAPVGANQTVSCPVNGSKDINLGLGATDADGDPLNYKVGTINIAHGTNTAPDANGHITYTPAAGYTGPDTFNYIINDGTADSALVTVTINVP